MLIIGICVVDTVLRYDANAYSASQINPLTMRTTERIVNMKKNMANRILMFHVHSSNGVDQYKDLGELAATGE